MNSIKTKRFTARLSRDQRKLKEYLECIEALRGVVDDVMPQIGSIVLQDYARLNTALILSSKILKEAGIPVE